MIRRIPLSLGDLVKITVEAAAPPIIALVSDIVAGYFEARAVTKRRKKAAKKKRIKRKRK